MNGSQPKSNVYISSLPNMDIDDINLRAKRAVSIIEMLKLALASFTIIIALLYLYFGLHQLLQLPKC